MTDIEWVQNVDGTRGKSWNPVAGCTLVSPGCTNCYAMRQAYRLASMGVEKYAGTVAYRRNRAVWTGRVNLDEDALTIPLRRRKPTTWFVNSMSDLFHEAVPDTFIDRVFATMALCPDHTFQILTKRPDRMAGYLADSRPCRLVRASESGHEIAPVPRWYDVIEGWLDQGARSRADGPEFLGSRDWDEADARAGDLLDESEWPLPNVWVGTSVEDQQRADERIPHLLRCPAAVRFLSCEPLLGPVNLDMDDGEHRGVDWVIVGGESGPAARRCDVDAITGIARQCREAGVPCFVKQDAGPRAGKQGRIPDDVWATKEMPCTEKRRCRGQTKGCTNPETR